MSDVQDEEGHRTKRFRHQSYNQQLKDVHAPSALERSKIDEALEGEECLFHGALSHWMQLNLSPSFISFAQKALPLSQSLALLVHSWREVKDLWVECARKSDDEALRALFDLIQKFVEDLRSTIAPGYESIISCLFDFLPRRISPEALSALLGTLLAIFKHVLLPSVPQTDDTEADSDILRTTWSHLSTSLTKCNPEVQRAVAEVWSSVLRRLKKGDRQRCVELMVPGTLSLDDFIAYSFVFAAKSVAQMIHTCGPLLILSCVDRYLTAPEDSVDMTMKLLRRVLTALIHHCAKAEQFTVIADPLVERLSIVSEPEDTKRLLNLLAVPCSVRQGSRLTQKQLTKILDTATKMTYSKNFSTQLLTIVSAALSASSSDLSVWMGAGRRAVEHVWVVDSALSVSLTGALRETGWKGFSQFALPAFLKNCLKLLDAEDGEDAMRVQTLRVLAKLAKEGWLKGTDEAWRGRLAAWVRKWLEGFKVSEDSIIILPEVLSLLPLLTSNNLLPSLIAISQDIINRDQEAKQLESDYYALWANESFVFGQLVSILSKSKHLATISEPDRERLVKIGIIKWSWSDHVIEGIAELAKSCQCSGSELTEDHAAIVKILTANLSSHSHIIRRSSLELLSLPGLFLTIGEDAVKRCLAAELIPMGVQGVRERVLLTAKVGQAVLGDPAGSEIARICVAWLLGQLKVGLRPVWMPAVQALAALSRRAPDIVWSMVFEELKGIDGAAASWSLPVWVSDAREEEDDVNEEERTWRDPSAHKLRVALGVWTSYVVCRNAIIEAQRPKDRFDIHSYEAQLLVAIGEFSLLAEKHSRELVPLFLSFASPSSAEKSSRLKLTNWLKLFTKFSNPKAFHSSQAVQTLFISLLAHPDRTLQTTALECLQTFKLPTLTRKKDTLTLLLDDTKWRDELTILDFAEVTPDERKDLVPVLIRLFYGMMRERGGRGKGADRRSALLGALGACTDDELTLLVDLMVEPFLECITPNLGEGGTWKLKVTELHMSEKQQIGFLEFLASVQRNLGDRVGKSWPRLVELTLTLTAHAQQSLQNVVVEDVGEDEEEAEGANENGFGEKAEGVDGNEPYSVTRLRQLRLVRQLGLKRLTEFFRLPTSFDFAVYMPELYSKIISPRIQLLDRENTQAPSSLFELLDIWSLRPDTALYLVRYDKRTLPKLYDCLIATNVKPVVQMRIFDLVERLLTFSEEETLSEALVKPFMSGLLDNVAAAVLLSTDSGTASVVGVVAQREISILSKLSPHITDGSQAATLLSLFLPQLRKAGRGIPEKAKVDMLDILCNLMPQVPGFAENQSALFGKTFETLSHLFSLLRGKQARVALVGAFKGLASIATDLAAIAELLAGLNSYSTTRMEEVDFDRRLAAFASLNEERWDKLSGKDWTPLLHNMLSFIQDEDELSIRNNASLSMKRFLDALSLAQGPEMQACFVRIVFPGLKRCLRAKSDLVRAEVMGVLAYAVEKCDNVNALQEMRILLASGDEEANFFNNIFHIQTHRRNRALHRLSDFCDEPGFRSSTLQEIFVPVVNSFIASSGTIDHHLVNEAVVTLGRIAKHLAWPAYFALVQQYIKLSTEKNAAERTYTRALVSVLDNFHFSLEDTFTEVVEANERTSGEDVGQAEVNIEVELPSVTTKIHDAVNNRLLPTLLKHLEKRDELEDVNRIPLAIGIVKVSLHLPEVSRDVQVPRLLTILSQVFRSKSQETRDVTRDTLCRITVMLGSSYLPMIIRQLREALLRGPHLHVLAFVTHALLVHITLPNNITAFDRLDDAVPDVVHVSAEVVFGRSGKDVDSEGFKTKMKEVRGSSSKGMDSFAILAKHITPASTSNLLLPIKAIMQETGSSKSMLIVDEVLRRMAVGLNANSHFTPSELLVFCYTLISQNARFFKENVKLQKRRMKKVNDAVVQMKRKIEPESDHYSHNSWRFVCFGLDLFNTAFRRGRFNFSDVNILARLEPMVNVIGNTLYAANGSVVSSGLKAAAQIVKCPLKNVEKSLPVLIRQTLQIIRQTGSTEADVTQAAFKSLAVIIRDCSASQLKEKDLTFLLELLTPDLEEVTRQATAFALLRAIVSRKFVVPEIYDLMERVSEIMVTSQSPQVQELCRSVLLQFLLDYPQGKARLKEHFAFMVKNLSYIFESGRKSVMELLSAVISKFSDDIILEYADMLFVALVLVLTNDDSPKCREMAARLIKTLVARLQEDQQKAIFSHVHSWAAQPTNPALSRVSSQTYGLLLDTLKADTRPYLSNLIDNINTKIKGSASEFEDADADEIELSEADWQVPYQALTAMSKVFQYFPDIILDHSKVSWSSIVSLLLYSHAWVRTASCRLLGSLFSVTPVSIPNDQLADDFPLSLNGMRQAANAFSLQLKSENLEEALSLQVVKNLFYIGKCFCAIPVPEMEVEVENAQVGENSDESSDEEEAQSEDEEVDGKSDTPYGNPLPWLFSRLSYQARSAHITRRNKPNQRNWSRQLMSIFQWFAAMASHMDGTRLERYLPHILSPLYRISEDDVIKDPQIDDLKTLASELQDLVQSKVGTTKFATVYNQIRQRVVSVQRERRTARAIQVATNPQATAKRKMHKNANKKDSRKRKNSDFGDRKIRMKFSKRRRTD